MPKYNDLTGRKFGRLTVIERTESNKCGKAKWKCVCECGNETTTTGGNLVQGITRSCGCLRCDHGKTQTRLYGIWGGIKTRCFNPHSQRYSDYGGRGITVCDEWRYSFEAFRDWAMAHGYRDDLTLDRIDVNGNYCPENCRWATYKEQASNTRTNRFITYDGKTMTWKQWAAELGIKYTTLHARLTYYHWDVEKAFTTAVRRKV